MIWLREICLFILLRDVIPVSVGIIIAKLSYYRWF